MFGTEEVYFQCPYCFEKISMVFESTTGGQQYIEDCEVCCRPIEIIYQVDEEGEINFIEGQRVT